MTNSLASLPRRLGALTAGVLAAGAGSSMPAAAADFDRPADLVRVFGDEVPALLGATAERYGVLAWHDGKLTPAPFQIDERNTFGFLILDQGPFAEKDLDDGAYDPNDEVLFFASDAGPRVPAETLDALPDLESWAEIELTDPVDGSQAFAYLVRSSTPAPRSPRDDVAYDPKHDRVVSTLYSMGFPIDEDGNHASYPDLFTVSRLAGGTGVDLIDRLKVRTEADLLFGLLSFSRSEDDFRTELLAWRDGPVRVVRRVETALHVIFGIYAPPIAVDAIYYRDFIETPNVLDMPFSLGSVLSSLTLRAGFDMNRAAYGMRVVTPDNPDAPPIDGYMSEAERALVTRDQPWYMVAGDQGALLVRMIFGDTLPLTQVLSYRDDAQAEDPPEDELGVQEVGRELEGGLAIERGRHAYNAFMFVPSHWRPGGEAPYLAMIDHPLAVRVTGPATVPPGAVADADEDEEGWRALYDEMRAAIGALDAYESTLLVYSSVYRGRKLEGTRTYDARFHRDPRWVYWEIPKVEANFDDPIGEGTEVAYYADEDVVVGRGAGVRRFFGRIEMKPKDAPSWWWGESATTLDLWAMAAAWERFLDPGRGRLAHVTIAGRSYPQLTLTSTRKAEVDLRNPLGTGAAQVEIKQLRITVDPETKLPIKIESFIPGNPAPVSSVELTELDTDVELERSDFDLSTF